MKKYLLLLILALFSKIIISCSNNDSNSTNSNLNGVWKLTSLTVETPILVNGIMKTDFTDMASDSQIEFNNNSIGEITYINGLGYTCETINNSVEFNSTSGIVTYPFEFSLNNNLVSIVAENNQSNLALTLNGNTLSMEKENGIVLTNLDNNTTENVTTIYVFTKH